VFGEFENLKLGITFGEEEEDRGFAGGRLSVRTFEEEKDEDEDEEEEGFGGRFEEEQEDEDEDEEEEGFGGGLSFRRTLSE
jgi:hypothetical protein